jgi:hypothetical protein
VSEPDFAVPEPVCVVPEPVCDVPEPVSDVPEPVCDVPEPRPSQTPSVGVLWYVYASGNNQIDMGTTKSTL